MNARVKTVGLETLRKINMRRYHWARGSYAVQIRVSTGSGKNKEASLWRLWPAGRQNL